MAKEEWYTYPTNLVDILEDTIKKFPDRNALGIKNSRGQYDYFTYKYMGERIDNLRAGLAQMGVEHGDSVGLIINNSLEWPIIGFATFGLGARLVPMYEKELEKIWKYIVQDSGLKILFVADETIYQKVKHYVDEIESLEKIFIIRSTGDNTMTALEKLGSENPVVSVKPDRKDIGVLIYTSGTTGDPKGVLLSHGNFTTNVKAGLIGFPDSDENLVSLSILPWAHSFGITSELFFNIYIGATTALVGSVETLMQDMVLVRPTVLIAVPRIFNRVYAGIHAMMREKGGLSEKLFYMAKDAAREKRETGHKGLKFTILDKMVFQKVRDMFGGRLKRAITGSAAMNSEIAQFFSDIGIATYDGYGLTETSPTISVNTPTASRLGSVGKAIQNVTIVIDKSNVGEDSEDGEIVAYGPNIMQGYHNKPEKTAEVFVEHPEYGKGVRTGDRGRLDEDGFLFITGRFKEEYKLENGKYVHPASIEEHIKLNPLVANAFIYGEGKRYNICLIVPDFVVLKKYAASMEIQETEPEKLVENQRIQEFVSNMITENLTGAYGGYEIPKKFLIIAEDFTLDNGLLTQTMKLKRVKVIQKYGDRINALYT